MKDNFLHVSIKLHMCNFIFLQAMVVIWRFGKLVFYLTRTACGPDSGSELQIFPNFYEKSSIVRAMREGSEDGYFWCKKVRAHQVRP